MQITPVNCNHCGASLQIPAAARFVTCRYCNAQLQIHRSESTITTEVLQRIDQNTASMAQDLQAIRRESEIERLDREWQLRESQLLTRDKDGSTSKPSRTSAIIVGLVVAGVGTVWTIGAIGVTRSMGPAPNAALSFVTLFFPCFGLIFIIAGIAMAISAFTTAGRYDEEHRDYLVRRQKLLAADPASDTLST